jgi:PAS domain S-box-containing protein
VSLADDALWERVVKTQGVQPTGREKTFSENDIIVSKTDLKGRITYANRTFVQVSGFSEEELLGQPHNIIRHPGMPQAVFNFLWDTLEQGREIFAYVKNMSRNGDHYWVFAHVTPTFDDARRIIGYHSSRRSPDRKQVELFEDIYAELRAEELRHADWRQGMQAATQMLLNAVAERKMEYAEFIFSV